MFSAPPSPTPERPTLPERESDGDCRERTAAKRTQATPRSRAIHRCQSAPGSQMEPARLETQSKLQLRKLDRFQRCRATISLNDDQRVPVIELVELDDSLESIDRLVGLTGNSAT